MNLNIGYMAWKGGDGARMSSANVQKKRRFGFITTKEDDNDTMGEGITAGLVLFLGVISIINSIGIVAQSVIHAINRQLVLVELLSPLVVAGLLLAIGLGSLYFFRRRLHMLKRDKSPWIL